MKLQADGTVWIWCRLVAKYNMYYNTVLNIRTFALFRFALWEEAEINVGC